MGRLGLAIREAAGDELLPPALTVPIEEPRKEPDERGESTCSDFDLIGVAAAISGCTNGNEMVPPRYETSAAVVSELDVELTHFLGAVAARNVYPLLTEWQKTEKANLEKVLSFFPILWKRLWFDRYEPNKRTGNMEQKAGRLHFSKTALWGAGQLNGSFDEHRSPRLAFIRRAAPRRDTSQGACTPTRRINLVGLKRRPEDGRVGDKGVCKDCALVHGQIMTGDLPRVC